MKVTDSICFFPFFFLLTVENLKTQSAHIYFFCYSYLSLSVFLCIPPRGLGAPRRRGTHGLSRAHMHTENVLPHPHTTTTGKSGTEKMDVWLTNLTSRWWPFGFVACLRTNSRFPMDAPPMSHEHTHLCRCDCGISVEHSWLLTIRPASVLLARWLALFVRSLVEPKTSRTLQSAPFTRVVAVLPTSYVVIIVRTKRVRVCVIFSRRWATPREKIDRPITQRGTNQK